MRTVRFTYKEYAEKYGYNFANMTENIACLLYKGYNDIELPLLFANGEVKYDSWYRLLSRERIIAVLDRLKDMQEQEPGKKEKKLYLKDYDSIFDMLLDAQVYKDTGFIIKCYNDYDEKYLLNK